MKEDFLYYIWKTKQFEHKQLKTDDGEALQIVHYGHQNHDSGPDFLNAKIKIGSTLWAGHLEMHLLSSDWKTHGHQADPAYQNVILHVVFDHDMAACRPDGSVLPTLSLRSLVFPGVYKKYLRLFQHKTWVPCQPFLPFLSKLQQAEGLDHMLICRLERKTEKISRSLEANNGNWEETSYQWISAFFGSHVNREAMFALAEMTPLQILWRHRDNLEQLEALLLGQAGFLNEVFTEKYPIELQREYRFLKHKYQLRPMPKVSWKFSKMRPYSFPTVRLAQLARFLFHTERLFGRLIVANSIAELEAVFDATIVTGYWVRHYHFGQASSRRLKKLGKQAIHTLIINAIVPLIFVYGQKRGTSAYKEKAIRLLQALPPEKNRITRAWSQLEIQAQHAGDSQALVELKSQFCMAWRCLECRFGHAFLSNTSNVSHERK